MGTTSRDSPTIRRPILTPVQRGDREGETACFEPDPPHDLAGVGAAGHPPVQRGDREGETACFEPESPHDLARGLVGDLIWALQTALSVPRARMGR
jgi:hypothetical protein